MNSQTFVVEGKNGFQLRQTKPAVPSERSAEGWREKTLCSLGGINVARIEHPRPSHPSVRSGCWLLLPLLFASTCAPSGKTADESQGRVCFAHSDLRSHTVPVILCSQAGPAGDAQPSSFKNPILAKVEIGQVKSIAYFILP